VPPAALALVTVAAILYPSNGGPLYLPVRTTFYIMAGRCVWACAATPSLLRIPLCATGAGGFLIALQLAGQPVSDIFVLAAAGLLYVNVVLVVLAPAEGSVSV
jgi:hypothetical protein